MPRRCLFGDNIMVSYSRYDKLTLLTRVWFEIRNKINQDYCAISGNFIDHLDKVMIIFGCPGICHTQDLYLSLL